MKKELTTILYPHDNGFIKAIVPVVSLDIFFGLGFIKVEGTQEKEPVIKTDPEPDGFKPAIDGVYINGDKGCGLPGTLTWDMARINELDDRKEIVNHVNEVTGTLINNRGRIDYLKKNAIKVLKEHYESR